jgi:hypothetical protein
MSDTSSLTQLTMRLEALSKTNPELAELLVLTRDAFLARQRRVFRWDLLFAALLVALGLMGPAILASVTQHQRYESVGAYQGVVRVLDTRTGQICYPGAQQHSFSGRWERWVESGKKCEGLELTR